MAVEKWGAHMEVGDGVAVEMWGAHMEVGSAFLNIDSTNAADRFLDFAVMFQRRPSLS